MARRRYQRGQLLRDGNRWIARWREDVRLPSGQVKRIRRKEEIATVDECPTKRLAQRKLDDRLREVNSPDYRPVPVATFVGFAQKWETTVMIHHKPSTQRSEKSVIKAQLVPQFGYLPLREITAEMIQRWVSESKLAPKTVRNMVVTMQAMWATAKAWGYVAVDPFEGLKLPTVTKGNTYHFSVEEALAIIEAAEGRWKVFFRILAETGMRPGELAGLRIEDVSVRSLRVSQSVWQRQIQTPKTPNAIRTFAISAGLGEAIRELIAGPKKNPFGLVFVTDPAKCAEGKTPRYEGGKPLSMDNFRHRVLNPILDKLGIRARVEAAGISRVGNYAFRHMNLTEMARLGVPMKTIQKRAGHALGSDVTLTHYIHSVDSDDIAAADMMGALLSPKQPREAVQ